MKNLSAGRQRQRTLICTSMLLFFSLTPLLAHDFWLASSKWNPPPGAEITVTANVGDDTFPVSENATAADRIDRLWIVGPGARKLTPHYRELGKSLAANVAMPKPPGTFVIVMSVKGRMLSLPPDKFEEYLKEEGLNDIVEARARLGEAKQGSRERYFRQAKMLIRTGDGPSSQVTKVTGLVAELVPDNDLISARVGSEVGVRLLYQGKPVKNAQIALWSAANPEKESRVTRNRTDNQGRARFLLTGKGPYLLAAVVMVRSKDNSGPDAADWESYWCSLTFNPGS